MPRDAFYDEIEIEDFKWDPQANVYHYPCPCGDRFEISKSQLRDGDEVARCPSCSLIVRVVYEWDDYEDYDSGEEQETDDPVEEVVRSEGEEVATSTSSPMATTSSLPKPIGAGPIVTATDESSAVLLGRLQLTTKAEQDEEKSDALLPNVAGIQVARSGSSAAGSARPEQEVGRDARSRPHRTPQDAPTSLDPLMTSGETRPGRSRSSTPPPRSPKRVEVELEKRVEVELE